MPQPQRSPSGDHAVVVVVDDWRGTFHIPDRVEHRLDAGPWWLVPVGGVLGILLSIVLRWTAVALEVVWLAGFSVFLTCVGAIALKLGGPRGATAAIAGATTAWVPVAAAVLAQGALDDRLIMAIVTVGLLGQVAFVVRARARVAEDRDVVVAARGGTRSEGWVVEVAGPPWDNEVRVEPSDGSGGSWTGSHAAWRAVQPRVGHPVGIWRSERPGTVVLLPRTH